MIIQLVAGFHSKIMLFRFLILMFDSDMEDIAAAITVICDHISDKRDSECEND